MEYFLGQIELFPYNFVPHSWMLCNGQMLNVNQYTALYSLIGAQFGGDGRTTFALPDLSQASPNPLCQYCICAQGIYPARS